MEIQWSLVLFTIISGTGGALFTFSVLQALLKKGKLPGLLECVVAIVLLGVGGAISATHIIYHLDRIVEALNNPGSGIFIEASGVAIMCVIIIVYLLMLWRKAPRGALLVPAVLGMLGGVVFAFECGNSYNMGARPAWETFFLPLAYCLTALAAGGALNLLMKALQRNVADEPRTLAGFALGQRSTEDEVAYAGFLAAVAGGIGLVGSLAFGIGAWGAAASAGGGAVATVVVMIVLELVTLGVGLIAWKRPARGVSLGAVTLATGFFGGVCMRVFMWLVGTPILDFFMMPLE